MGGFCSRSATVDDVPSSRYSQSNGHSDCGAGLFPGFNAFHTNGISELTLPSGEEYVDKPLGLPSSLTELGASTLDADVLSYGKALDDNYDGIPQMSRVFLQKSRSTKSKVSEVSFLLSKAGSAGFDKAVEVLDTLGSSMTSLNHSGSFVSGVTTKGNKISILAFEVANTVMKGANLMQSVSEDNIRHLKEMVLPSEGVQSLVSKDIDELNRIAAADKREELKVFSGEVVRFGNYCKDPQYHNLDRYFDKLASELTPQKQLKKEAKTIMQQLVVLVQFTAELYHELHALDRVEQDYRRKLHEDDNTSTAQRGDSLTILRAELKSQRKHVRSLKKKSLWSRILEEVMRKLVDIVHFLHLEIYEAFGNVDINNPVKSSSSHHNKLGSAGLALHYANIITQIDTLMSRSMSVPPTSRDALYHALPPNVKSALRAKLQSFQLRQELTIPQIKAEMEKTLDWLVPIATNTTKAHHGFGWVGEWANTGADFNQKSAGQSDLLRIETLYHADKAITESYILDLVVWLHHLVTISRVTPHCGTRSPIKSPIRSSNQKIIYPSPQKAACSSPTLTMEDRLMLSDVPTRKLTPGISKSQEFHTSKNHHLSKHHRLCKSISHSPVRENKRELYSTKRSSSVPIFNFDIDRAKALDVIDRVDILGSL